MKAVQLTSRGKSGIGVADCPQEELFPGFVRLRMLAASVNRVDLYMRDSGEGIRHSLPLIMGVDGVGEVIEIAGASDFRIGQRVIIYPYSYCGQCRYCQMGDQTLCNSAKIFGEHIDGTFRNEMVVPSKSVLPLSDSADVEQAAALGVAYLTAWRMVFGKGPVEPGMRVLVQGAGGGVSYAAMQLARLAGAKTIVTTTGAQKVAHFKGLGVDVIDYREARVPDAVMSLTSGEGADLVIDNSGEASWPASLRSLARGGRIVTCGATTGGHPSAELQRLFIRQFNIHGSTMGSMDELRRLLRAFEAGEFEPMIDSRFPLSEIGAAFERQEAPERMGKVVLRIAD